MSKRKLIKFGKSSYMVILPKKWISSLDLKDGDSLNVEYKENRLSISPSEIKIPEKEKVIEFSKKDYPKLLRYKIITSYLNGFTSIIVNFDEKIDKKQLEMINGALGFCVGLSIYNQREKSIVIKDLLDEKKINNLSEQIKTIKMQVRNCLFVLQEHLMKKVDFGRSGAVDNATKSIYLGIRSSAIVSYGKYSSFLIMNNLLLILRALYSISHLKEKKGFVEEIERIKELYDGCFLALFKQKKLKEVYRLKNKLKLEYQKMMGSRDSQIALFGEYCKRIVHLLSLISELEFE